MTVSCYLSLGVSLITYLDVTRRKSSMSFAFRRSQVASPFQQAVLKSEICGVNTRTQASWIEFDVGLL